MARENVFIRNIQADILFEIFIVSAVISIFFIRFFLFVTNYPQLGGSGIHIAHMLWGGFFMVAAIIILLSFLNKTAIAIGAGLGGIGFGVFIDELGKFITSDNNYFFQPTFSIIYVIFIIMYLIFRTIPSYKAFSQKEYLINALDLTKEAVINDLDIEEERIALEYLKHCDPQDPIVRSLTQLLNQIDTIQLSKPGFIARLRTFARYIYHRLTQSQFFAKLVITALIIQSISAVIFIMAVFTNRLTLAIDQWGVLITSVFSALFVFYGTILLRRSRLHAFREFKTAVFISIFLTQFFIFYRAHLYAVIALIFNIGVLLVIQYVLTVESESVRSHTISRMANSEVRS